MNKFKFYRLIIKFRGIFFFVFLLIFPLICLNLFRYILITSGNVVFKDISNDRILIIPIHYISFIMLLVFIYKYSKKSINFFNKENWFFSMEKAIRPAIKAFALGFFCTIIIDYLLHFIPGLEYIKNWFKTPNYGLEYFLENFESQNQLKVIFLFFYIIVLAPVYEEILFRGFLQDSLQKLFKKNNLDVVIGAIIFALFHIASLSNTVFAFVIGVYLCKKRKEENGINTTIWIHAIVNFTGLLSGILYLFLEKKFLQK